MNIFTDLFYMNKSAFKKTSKLLVKNWPIIFTGFVYSTLSLIVGLVLSVFLGNFILRFVVGILLFAATIALTSNYLYLLYNVVKNERLTFQDFKDGFTAYMRKLWTIFFIGWVAELVYSAILAPLLAGLLSGVLDTRLLNIIVSLLVLILINPLPETVYQKHYQPADSIKYAFDFVKENWIEWFIPNVILFGILYLSTGVIISDFFTFNIGFSFNFSPMSILMYLLAQIIFSFTMIYRGVLFEILSTSTRRKRMFMRNMYK
ncbi:hypothetical protein [Sporosalibacterium faouarense]|uniref:hypothetical protein n=1 Tax=Sporosalibacterium faouarense TaxID=516123 RepID=UPI00141C3FDF|nr:hypothetical protein [Sporosalibacterium faouarense]MTI49488.1 hypothetical protein [Bacillota bacterium]